MSWDINKVIIIGRLSSDVELKYTPSGSAVSRFGIAVGGKPKPDGGDSVSFFNVVLWGKLAENCSNYLTKGKQIALEGRLEQRSWQAQDGTKRSVVEIIADRVEFLGNQTEEKVQARKQDQPQKANSGQGQGDPDYFNVPDFNPAPVNPGENSGSDKEWEPNF